RVSSGAEGVESSHTKRAPFTARTTGVSNPVCSPGLRVSLSGTVQRPAFATGLPHDLYAFHCYTMNSSLLSSPQAPQYRMQIRSYTPKFHTRLTAPPTLPLRPMNPINAWDLCITVAACTEFAVPSSSGPIKAEAVK